MKVPEPLRYTFSFLTRDSCCQDELGTFTRWNESMLDDLKRFVLPAGSNQSKHPTIISEYNRSLYLNEYLAKYYVQTVLCVPEAMAFRAGRMVVAGLVAQ